MKMTTNAGAILFAVLITAISAQAQMMGGGRSMMQDPAGQQASMPQQQNEEPFLFLPGMMGCGGGIGPGMMMGGMGPGMMMGGMGRMHHHMMEDYGWGPGMKRFRSPGQYDKFLDETREQRKKMHDLRFEYGEMMRNPATTMGDLQKMEQQIYELQQQILEQSEQQ